MRYAKSLMWYLALLCIAGAVGIDVYINSNNVLIGIKSGLIAFGLGCIFSLVGNYIYNKLS
jgi:hypothetical protein